MTSLTGGAGPFGPMTNFPSGVSSWGVPLLGSAAYSIPGIASGVAGRVFFVAEGGAGSGSSPDSPMGTIQGALDQTTDGAGDTILVAPGTYDENLVVSNSAVSIMGMTLGGYERPDIVCTTGVALSVTTGQGFVARHLRFSTDADSDTVVQNANGFVYEDCVFDGTATAGATKCLLRLVPSATDDSYSASEGVVSGCLFRGSTSGIGIGMQYALAAGGGEGTSDNQIVGNRFIGNGVDLKSLTNTNGGGVGIYLRYVIASNWFMTGGSAYVYADMDQGAAGDLAANSCLITGNWFADDAIVAAQFAIAGQPTKVFFVGNYDAAGLINGSAFNN